MNKENEKPRTEEMSGTPEESYKAATAGAGAADEASHDHPTEVFHARESTGRHADEGWKKDKDQKQNQNAPPEVGTEK